MVKPLSFKLVWDREALDNFKDILNWLEDQSEQAPGIVKSAVFSKLDAVLKNPLISEVDKLKTPISKEFRAFVVFSYRITYQIKAREKEVRILRIRHTSREPVGY